MYTHTLSEIQCTYPNVAEHLQSFYQLMFQNVEMYEGKPCRYDDVHDLIATFYPITLQEPSRHTFPSTKPDDAHHAEKRPVYELNVRVIHDLLARPYPSLEVSGDKRKSTSQVDDNDTNTCTGNGKKITILESDIDTNTGRREQDDSTVRELHNLTYPCDKPIDYSKNSQVSGQLDNLSVHDLCDKEYIEEDVKTKCKVEVAETEVNKANTVIGIKIEIQIPIDNGDSKITVLVTAIKIIEAVPEMRVTTIIITEGITIQEEVIGATLRAGVVIETLSQLIDPHPHLTLINTVRFAIKQVICLMNVSL